MSETRGQITCDDIEEGGVNWPTRPECPVCGAPLRREVSWIGAYPCSIITCDDCPDESEDLSAD